MLNFQRRQRPRNYLARSEQWRLLGLVVLAALTLAALRVAGNAESWRWLLPQSAGDGPAAAPRTRHPANLDGELLADAFLSPAAPAAEAEKPPQSDRYFTGVRPDYLRTVRDDTVHRGSERDAWFHLLEILAKTDDRDLAAASLGRVSFLQLDDQPKSYRGRLVTLAGTVHGARLLKAPKNDYGISDYYQLALAPAGGPAEPIIIYALQLPAGFPEGEKTSAEVELTGFFYKRWAYQAHDRPRVAPLVLAHTVSWKQAAPVADHRADPLTAAILVTACVALGTLGLFAWYWIARQRAARRREQLQPTPSPALFQSLQGAPLAATPEELLADLARRESPP